MKKLLTLTALLALAFTSTASHAADMSSTIANQLQLEMRQKEAPAGIQPGMSRVRGVIVSVGDGGALLRPVGAAAWVKKTRSFHGKTSTAMELSGPRYIVGGAAFVEGVKGKIGQMITTDAHDMAPVEMTVDGRKAKVSKFKALRSTAR